MGACLLSFIGGRRDRRPGIICSTGFEIPMAQNSIIHCNCLLAIDLWKSDRAKSMFARSRTWRGARPGFDFFLTLKPLHVADESISLKKNYSYYTAVPALQSVFPNLYYSLFSSRSWYVHDPLHGECKSQSHGILNGILLSKHAIIFSYLFNHQQPPFNAKWLRGRVE